MNFVFEYYSDFEFENLALLITFSRRQRINRPRMDHLKVEGRE